MSLIYFFWGVKIQEIAHRHFHFFFWNLGYFKKKIILALFEYFTCISIAYAASILKHTYFLKLKNKIMIKSNYGM